MKIKLAFLFLIVSTILLAQPSIVVVPEELEGDTMVWAETRFFGVPWQPIYIKNTGTETVELGLSAEWAFRVVDTVDAVQDTVTMWGYFSDTLAYPPLGDTMDYILETPRFSSDGFYGLAGLSLAPGDSVFLSYKITMHLFSSMPPADTSRVFIYARTGAEIDTAQIRQSIFVLGAGIPSPESLLIDSIETTIGSEKVFLQINGDVFDYGVDWLNVYRDTTALFYMSQLDSSNLLPDRFLSTTFVDSFSDALWEGYWMSSRGIGDTLVNLFYVCTCVDTGAGHSGGYLESPNVSGCVCEYDQSLKSHPVLGSVNIISIPCYDERYTTASDLEEFGVNSVHEWNPFMNTWTLRGYKLPPGIWSPNEPLQVSHVYRISGIEMDTLQLFSTFKPGLIPDEDTVYTLCQFGAPGVGNIIMLPFKTSYLEGIQTCSDLASSMEACGVSRVISVERWNNETQTWSLIGSSDGYVWTLNGRLRPGLPYRVNLNAYPPIRWPAW